MDTKKKEKKGIKNKTKISVKTAIEISLEQNQECQSRHVKCETWRCLVGTCIHCITKELASEATGLDELSKEESIARAEGPAILWAIFLAYILNPFAGSGHKLQVGSTTIITVNPLE